MTMEETTANPTLKNYLSRVRSHLPLGQSRDILLELESTIRDRVEDRALLLDREPDEAMYDEIVAEMGDPEKVAANYVDERYLVGPEEFRPFLLYTSVLFALHMVVIGIATALDRALQVGPLSISPMGTHGFLSMAICAVHALLFDVGVAVVLLTALRAARKRGFTTPGSLAVECGWRHAGTRAVLAMLVCVVLTFFRDDLFVIVSGKTTHPLFTDSFAEHLPLVTVVLLGSATAASLYGALGERRLTLAVDAAHGVIGVAVMLFLLGGDAMLSVPAAEMFDAFREPANAFLAQLGNLVLGFVALGFGAKTVRRLMRLAQI